MHHVPQPHRSPPQQQHRLASRRRAGANDGIVSTASLIIGVAAADATQNAVLVAGVAGLVAGAMSMAAGEYVSVSSQADTEQADLARERQELSWPATAHAKRPSWPASTCSAGWMPTSHGRWPCN